MIIKTFKMVGIITGLLLFVFSPLQAQNLDKAGKNKLNKIRKTIQAHKKISSKAKTFAIKNLLPMTQDPVIVQETVAQNNKNVPLSEIQRIDKAWIKAEDELPIQKEMLSNTCAQKLKALLKDHPLVIEAFVMDNQGAVVCENNLTGDYWQGDEAKWQKSFNKGRGGVDAGKIKFDKSANAKLQQISLPIIVNGGKIIGAITFGIAVEKL